VAESLFVYGTLMFPEIRSVLVGREFRTSPAFLHGYRRRSVFLAGRAPMPGIVADEAASVSGILLRSVDSRSLRIFDTFEGMKAGLYDRLKVSVSDGEGKTVEVSTYVPGLAARGLGKGEWDPDVFRRRHLAAYRRRIIALWR
jgi:gamma-glutamylcyclotransferase (GGCT)/AIG2-like uncharacterized protein YtfP